MAEIWRCEICGEGYIGDEIPSQCPFCCAKKRFMKQAKQAIVDFNVSLNEKDLANVKHAFEVELSNAGFYFCAASKTDDDEGKCMFKRLAKVELEHASIWKKILKLETAEPLKEQCFTKNSDNLQESHDRETKAIEFYKKAAKESENIRIKQLFAAIVEVEMDHLSLSENRM